MNSQDQAQVQQMIQQAIAKNSQTNRFNVQNQGRHIHNDIDSPLVFQPVLQYVGAVNFDGTPLLLPTGWTSSISGGTIFTITHNLNKSAYSVILTELFYYDISAMGQAGPGLNDFEVSWTESDGSTLLSSPFYFTLTDVTNKNQKPVSYYGPWTATTSFDF